MKKLVFILILLIPFLAIQAQGVQKNKRELKKEQKAKRMEEVKQMMNDHNFVFRPTQAIPMSGSTIQLDFSFSAKIKGDTIDSYLPYYGRAYHVDYGAQKGPFNFTLPIKDYTLNNNKNGYVVNFEVQKGQDNIKYNFTIFDNGFTNLNIVSTNRQPISYYGTIEKPENKE